ncbi:MAG: FAD-binding protein [Coriobacteriales bacterium]|nr:FAD-binding protein [Coriobacteriales bacterium]
MKHGAGSVLLLEKMEAGRVGGGVHGVLGSKWSDEAGFSWTPEEIDDMIKEEIKASSMRADERYYRVWAARSREAFASIAECFDTQWVHLVNDGAAPYDQVYDEYFSESVYPGQALQVSSSDVNTPMINGLLAWIKDNGGEFRFNTKAEQLILEDGKIAGVYAIKEDGNYLKVNAKAVIAAGGSIEGNDEMFAEFCPHVYPIKCSNYAPGDGSVISMCVWAGAQIQSAPISTMANTAISPDAPNVPSPIPFIVVNRNGKRFVNEATSSFCIPFAIINQPGKVAYQIFDKHYAEAVNELSMQTWMGTFLYDEARINRFENEATKADSLEELAEKLGIDPEGLVATVENYRVMAENGHDDEFGVRQRFLKVVCPMDPPFYGMEMPYFVDVACGGIVCDPYTQRVLDGDGVPIPGLFAAGNTVGERFGMAYTNNMCGLSNGFADVGGYISGESAAAYVNA